MKKVMEMTLLTLMPIRDAASLSMLTARIWPPILVLATSPVKGQHRDGREHDHDDLRRGDGCAEDIEGLWREERGERARVRADERQGAREVLQEHRHADRRDQGDHARFVAQGAICDGFHAGGNTASHDHRDEDDAADGQHRIRPVDGHIVKELGDKVCTKRADHQEVAVRGVDHADDTIDHGIAQRQQRVNTSQLKAVY